MHFWPWPLLTFGGAVCVALSLRPAFPASHGQHQAHRFQRPPVLNHGARSSPTTVSKPVPLGTVATTTNSRGFVENILAFDLKPPIGWRIGLTSASSFVASSLTLPAIFVSGKQGRVDPDDSREQPYACNQPDLVRPFPWSIGPRLPTTRPLSYRQPRLACCRIVITTAAGTYVLIVAESNECKRARQQWFSPPTAIALLLPA